MATIKSYTDLEQSKKLAEILPLESADMHYNVVGDAIIGGYQIGITKAKLVAKAWKKNPDEFAKNVTPCWSLAALLNLLPSEFTEKGECSETTYNIKIRKYALTKDVDIHQIAYGSIKFDVDGQYSFKDMINTGEKEDLLDAVFQMICWLKENGKL